MANFLGLGTGEKNKEVVFFEDTYSKTSAVDGFNKNNMAYFSDLFLANEKIYWKYFIDLKFDFYPYINSANLKHL